MGFALGKSLGELVGLTLGDLDGLEDGFDERKKMVLSDVSV